ncbi:MAG: hypothetical protein ACSW8H_01335 [bacterium]
MSAAYSAAEVLRLGKREEEALPALSQKIADAERLHAHATEILSRLTSENKTCANIECLRILSQVEATLQSAAKLLSEADRELTAVHKRLSEAASWLSADVPLTPFGPAPGFSGTDIKSPQALRSAKTAANNAEPGFEKSAASFTEPDFDESAASFAEPGFDGFAANFEDSEFRKLSDMRRAQLLRSARTAVELSETARVLSESILVSQEKCRTHRLGISAAKSQAEAAELLEALAKTRAAVRTSRPGK